MDRRAFITLVGGGVLAAPPMEGQRVPQVAM
jgi:hypothetical protein